MTFSWSPATRASAHPAPAIKHVLYDFDGPKMVLAHDVRGRQLLGVAADQDDDGTMRWIFAPAAPERVVGLLETARGLRDLFDSGTLEIHDIDAAWTSLRAWTVAPDDVPLDLLPEPDAELPALADGPREALVADQRRLVEQRKRVARARLLFEGRPVRQRRGISADFAAEVLSSYQALVSLAYGHRRKGSLRSTGRIPERDASLLMLEDMPRGSVGFELVENIEHERVVATELSEVVVEVGELLEASAADDSAYAECVADFDGRVVAELHRFLETLRKNGATLRLGVEGHEYAFDASRIADAVDRTAKAPAEEDDRPVVGELIGFLPTDRRFELKAKDRVLKGKIARDADTQSIASLFGKPCMAHLHVITVERSGRRTEAFTLLRVEDPPG